MRRLITVLALLVAAAAWYTPSASAACPNASVRGEQQAFEEKRLGAGHATNLPDCRGYELVTPVNKANNEASGPFFFTENQQDPFQARREGAGSTYSLDGAQPESESAALFTSGISTQSNAGSAWSQMSLAPTSLVEQVSGVNHQLANGEFLKFSGDLSCGVQFSTTAETAHPGETTALLPEGEKVGRMSPNLYLWESAGNTRRLVTEIAPRNPEAIHPGNGGGWTLAGMSEGCSRIAFNDTVGQGYEIPKTPGTGYYPPESRFEWTPTGGMKIASLVPAEEGKAEVPAEHVLNVENGVRGSDANLISSDGSHLYFSAGSVEAGPTEGEHSELNTIQIFDRFEGKETIAVSHSKTAVPDRGAAFQLATSDGHRVFFLANHGLVAGGEATSTTGCTPAGTFTPPATQAGCDLYEYEFNPAEHRNGILRDLTPTSVGGTGASVRGVVGTSADGSYVYFTSTGQLVAGKGRTFAQNEGLEGGPACHSTNLYAYHEGTTTFVANVSLGESGATRSAPGGCAGPTSALDAIAADSGEGQRFSVARVSPNGEYVMFATSERLKSVGFGEYNNSDSISGKPDPIMYEYKYTTGEPTISCLSCKPGGGAPTVPNGVAFGPKGPFQPVNGAGPINTVMNDGRVFYTSVTPLVEGATTVMHAYEYQPNGYTKSYKSGAETVYSEECASETGCIKKLEPAGNAAFPTYIEGVSENGENVYLTTVEPLTWEDLDGLRDLYDVRELGGLAEPAGRPACNLTKDECQGKGPEKITVVVESAGGGEAGSHAVTELNGAEETFAARVASVKAGPRSARVRIEVFGTGTLHVSGRGIYTLRRHVRPGYVTVTIRYTRRTVSSLRRHHKLRLVLRASLTR